MKKLISLLLALIMLISLAVPAFAVDEPTEIGPNETNEIRIPNKGNCIINEDCEVKTIMSNDDNSTLTIAKGVTVKVTEALFYKGSINVLGTLIITDTAEALNNGTINVVGTLSITGAISVNNSGTINVRGTLIITDTAEALNNGTINVVGTLSITGATDAENYGTVRVCGCTGGKLEGTINNSGFGTVTTYDGHYYVDGKCFACGYECPHEDLKCNTCGKKLSQKAISSEGGIASTISEGNVSVIVGIACAAVFGIGGYLLGSKKKKEKA